MTKLPTHPIEAPLPLHMQVLRKFRTIFGTMRQHFHDIERHCGVSGSQVWMLQEVAKRPEIGVSELAQCLSIHTSTCSLLVEKLVSAGALDKTRSAVDQRRVGLRLTPVGATILSKVPGPAEGVLPRALSELPSADLMRLDADLSVLIERLGASGEVLSGKPLADM